MDKYSLLQDPWVTVDGQIALTLNNELNQEMTKEHPLNKKVLKAVARSEASDDVLYQDQESQHYYLVHLTWANQKSGEYPIFKMFSSLEGFIMYCKRTFLFHAE